MPTEPLPALMFTLGAGNDAFEHALKKAADDKLVARLWAHDFTLWEPKPDEIDNRLGWLDITSRVRPEIPRLEKLASDAIEAGIRHVLLLGMGGSSLAPEVFSKIFGPAKGHPDLHVLDSTDPAAVSGYAQALPPGQTLYIVATKSGGTTETLSFFKYFYNLAQAKLGDQVGSHFVAITDPGSKLVDLAKQYRFRETFLNDPNIGGRYSALSFFGSVPAALLGVDLDEFFARAEAVAAACQNPDLESNPGARLGLVISSLAKAGRDKLTFRIPAAYGSFGDWVEQLVAESTGKSGTGILPIAHEPEADPGDYGDDRVFVSIELEDDKPDNTLNALTEAGHPVLRLTWGDRYDLGAHFFLWEFAIAVAGYGLGIHPFNQPNVEAAKVRARQLVEQYAESGELPKGDEQPIGAAALQDFLGKPAPGAYIALQAYLPPAEDITTACQQLRARLIERYHLATTFGYGPRFLHSTGQEHKGDSGHGLFVQLLSPPPEDDLPVPKTAGGTESEISFGVLKNAQALGDAQALRDAGRMVLTLEVSGDPAAEIKRLTKSLK